VNIIRCISPIIDPYLAKIPQLCEVVAGYCDRGQKKPSIFYKKFNYWTICIVSAVVYGFIQNRKPGPLGQVRDDWLGL